MRINSKLNIQLLICTYVMLSFSVSLFTGSFVFGGRITRIILYSLLFVAAIVELCSIFKYKLKIEETKMMRDKVLYICYLISCVALAGGYIYQLVIKFCR